MSSPLASHISPRWSGLAQILLLVGIIAVTIYYNRKHAAAASAAALIPPPSIAEATAIASKLCRGMREKEADKVLTLSGLSQGPSLGCSHGWKTGYYWGTNHWSIALQVSAGEIHWSGFRTGGRVDSATVESNGIVIAQVRLTNRFD
jgi:hypothetical protein